MNTTTTTISFVTRFAMLREQRAYERRIRAFGAKAAIAPYRVKPVGRIPRQRVGS